MSIEFKNRPLIEVQMNQSDFPSESEYEKIIVWCEDYCTFSHTEFDEFLFWIPPYEGYEKYLEAEYKSNIPDSIYVLLKTVIEKQSGEADSGYLLIVFLD